jgi:signal transduction histidine kinase
MSIRDWYEKQKADIRRGASDAADDIEAIEAEAEQSKWLVVVVGVPRMLLYGFLVAYPGVGLLPWGQPKWIAVALLAAALSALKFPRESTLSLYRLLAIALLVAATVRLGAAPSTSIILIGAFVSAAASAVMNFPFLYGFVVGMAGTAVAVQVFNLNWFHERQLLLSGRAFTPDRSGAEALHLAGFMFVVALIHFGRYEADLLKARAQRAEAARDAAVVDERARIARELHDVVSHHVTAMTLQAEAAAMTGDKAALTSVASAGREALTELRRMLGVLRHPDDETGAALDPQPDLRQLDQLASRTSSGPAVRLERRGDVRPLSAGLELCAYRLVQESLTNAAKHSDATTVEVVLTYGASDLTVDVVDNGRPLVAARVGSGGLGLVGMRERVALLDGDLSTGPRPGARGYRVHARLPIDG